MATSQWHFPELQLPNCAISKAATPAKLVLASAVLGPSYPLRSAPNPFSNLWVFVPVENCTFGKFPLGKSHLRKCLRGNTQYLFILVVSCLNTQMFERVFLDYIILWIYFLSIVIHMFFHEDWFLTNFLLAPDLFWYFKIFFELLNFVFNTYLHSWVVKFISNLEEGLQDIPKNLIYFDLFIIFYYLLRRRRRERRFGAMFLNFLRIRTGQPLSRISRRYRFIIR